MLASWLHRDPYGGGGSNEAGDKFEPAAPERTSSVGVSDGSLAGGGAGGRANNAVSSLLALTHQHPQGIDQYLYLTHSFLSKCY